MSSSHENEADASQHISSNEEYIFSNENENGFIGTMTIHQDQLRKINQLQLSLKSDSIFSRSILDRLSRKNEIIYCVNTQEKSIDIKDVEGTVYLPLVTKQEIDNKLSKIKSSIAVKINTLHLGAVKILIKAHFREGINSPIKMALLDNRLIDREDSLIGAAKGNLAYGKFMFTVYPKYAINLNDRNLNRTLSFIHKFDRENFMEKGSLVFSVTYLIGYALTNSHHSIDYRTKPKIEIDQLFLDIGKVHEHNFCNIVEDDNSWVMNVHRNKPELGQPSQNLRIKGNNISIGNSSSGTIPTQRQLLEQVAKNVDRLGNQLQYINGE
ncbi:movement protein [Eupatorium vein clearing virus]|uniref:movement protein n=1 Tax=Eupatorium vein clearing virus TaxID=515444 RepID=UPI000172CAD4|nr:movement protein [Eupatorium vein clearing virus]ACB69769.1 movement protein [Eupatorium vein clearing virus]